MAVVAYSKRCAAEAIGTALLLTTVVGSGIMGERLAGGNVAMALLANSIATGAGLASFIFAFGSISGAHFNPVVTLAAAGERSLPWAEVPGYVLAQFLGAGMGVLTANVMFGEPLVSLSRHPRPGLALALSEAVATFGLLTVIRGGAKRSTAAIAVAVGAYIAAAYWFTASTSFANPAVTLARAFTDTFSGIRLAEVPGFIAAQLGGGVCAFALFRWLDDVDSRRAAS
jgi:glycerol uptake facilitator-like aquaporin